MALIRNRNITTLFDAETLAQRNDALAQEIAQRGKDNLLVIAVLKGSFIFAADLVRSLHKAGLAPEIEFITLSSYGTDTTSSGTVRVVRDIESDVRGRNVLLIDDILGAAPDMLEAPRGLAQVYADGMDVAHAFRELPFVGVVSDD